jgi:hypothetical protein
MAFFVVTSTAASPAASHSAGVTREAAFAVGEAGLVEAVRELDESRVARFADLV